MKIINYDELIKYLNYDYVIINISASWCKPCLEIKPKINNLLNEFKQDNFIYLELDYHDYEQDEQFHFIDCNKLPHFTFMKNNKHDETIESSNFDLLANKIYSFFNIINDDF